MSKLLQPTVLFKQYNNDVVVEKIKNSSTSIDYEPSLDLIRGNIGNSGIGLLKRYYLVQEKGLAPLITMNYADCNAFMSQGVVNTAMTKIFDAAVRHIYIEQEELTQEENKKINIFINQHGGQNSLIEKVKKAIKISHGFGTSAIVIKNNQDLDLPISSDTSYEDLVFDVFAWQELSPFAFNDKQDSIETGDVNFNFYRDAEYFYINTGVTNLVNGTERMKIHKSRVLWILNSVDEKRMMYRMLQGRGASIFEFCFKEILNLMVFQNIILQQNMSMTRTHVVNIKTDNYNDEEAAKILQEVKTIFSNFLTNPSQSAIITRGDIDIKPLTMDANNLNILGKLTMQAVASMYPGNDRGFFEEEQKSHTSEVESLNKQERNLDLIRGVVNSVLRELIIKIINPIVLKKNTDNLSSITFKYTKKEPSINEKNQTAQIKSSIIDTWYDKGMVDDDEVRDFLKTNEILTSSIDNNNFKKQEQNIKEKEVISKKNEL